MNPASTVLRLDYLEFAARDVAVATKFYSAAFGWTFTDYGPDYTSFTDGRLSGGFFRDATAPAKTNPLAVLYSGNLESTADRILAAGGQIVKPAFDFPGGRRFHFTDPNGLELSVWSDRRADGSPIG